MSAEDGKLFQSAGDQLPLPTYPEECRSIRNVITGAQVTIGDMAILFMDEGHPAAQDQDDQVNDALEAVKEAFDCKPEGCGMQCDSSGNYYCKQCDFEADLSPMEP